MKLYTCDNCKNLLYFENSVCLKCGYTLGFDDQKLDLITLSAESNGSYIDVKQSRSAYKMCANATYGTCNWLVPLTSPEVFCQACLLNRTIPTLTDQNVDRWKRIEVAKHRLVYSLLRLHLPIAAKEKGQDKGIAFDFLTNVSADKRVVTGHNKGVITLNIEEADEAKRVRNKLDLGEKYRTLLGHFRHEIGHYYWDLKIKDTALVHRFRKLFGDERTGYPAALTRYYANGPAPDWTEHFFPTSYRLP